MDSKHVSIDIKTRRSVIEIDLNHLHPRLGKLAQRFELNEDDAFAEVTGKQLFDSVFQLYPPGGAIPQNFQYLPRDVKDQVWQAVFEAKKQFFDLRKPDIVSLYVKHPFSFEKRYERYTEGLRPLLPDYDIFSPGARRVFFERKGP